MKRIFLFSWIISTTTVLNGQSLVTGALATDPSVYRAIGQAPLPMGSDIPSNVDLSPYMPPVGNQYPQNSCVAWAVAYANYSYLNKINNGCEYIKDGALSGNCLFSPSFIYNQINGGQNVGTHFSAAFDVMLNQGLAPLSSMPYQPYDWWSKPSIEAKNAASAHKIVSVWQLGRSGNDFFNEARAYLAKGYPIIVSVKVDDYLKNGYHAGNPYVWTSWKGTVESMGHAIVIVGYDDYNGRFKFLNSYGEEWGNSGYGYISYGMFRQVLNEAFITKPKNPNLDNEKVIVSEQKTLSNSDIETGLNFIVNNVEHFQFSPTYIPTPEELFSKEMKFRGTVSIPQNVGKTFQVLIYFYLNNYGKKGPFIYSSNPITRTLNGQAVTGTPVLKLTPNSKFQDTFEARIRYVDLNINKGYPSHKITTHLIAEPVLLVDGFPVRIGELHQFYVNL